MGLLGKPIEVHRNKTAGGAAETIYVNIPRDANRVKWWARHLGAIPINNNLFAHLDANTTSANFSADGSVALFNLDGSAAGTSSTNENESQMAATRLAWTIRANAGTNTQFYLRVCFFDV